MPIKHEIRVISWDVDSGLEVTTDIAWAQYDLTRFDMVRISAYDNKKVLDKKLKEGKHE